MLALMLLELVTSSVLFVLLPAVAAGAGRAGPGRATAGTWPVFGRCTASGAHMTLTAVLFGVLMPDCCSPARSR